MEDVLRPIYQERVKDPETLGAILIGKTKQDSPITDNVDVILLIIVKDSEKDWQESHYEFHGKTAVMHTITENLLTKWINTNGYRKAAKWIMAGKIIFECDGYVSRLKDHLSNFSQGKRNLRKAMEFGKLLKSYMEVKDLYSTEQYKDAYSRMVHSLHYLARLAEIERGYYPEVTLWNQVKTIDPEVYRLYEELIESHEDVAKRVHLMILAADFVINRRAKMSAKHLLETLDSRKDAWSYEEIKRHPSVKPYEFDLTAMLNYLTEKGIIETEKIETKAEGVYKRKYKVNLGEN